MSDGGEVLTGPWKAPEPNDYPNEGGEQAANGAVGAVSLDWELLQDAANLISGQRQEEHGNPERCHDEIAKLWSWWVGIELDRHDVAIMMDLLKTARIKTGGPTLDHYRDKAGYTALAARFRFSPR